MDTLDDFLDTRLHGRQKPDATRVDRTGGKDPSPHPLEGMTTAGIGGMFAPADPQAPMAAGPHTSQPPIETTARAPHKPRSAVEYLVNALHTLVNPTAGAEAPESPSSADESSPDWNHEQKWDDIRSLAHDRPELKGKVMSRLGTMLDDHAHTTHPHTP